MAKPEISEQKRVYYAALVAGMHAMGLKFNEALEVINQASQQHTYCFCRWSDWVHAHNKGEATIEFRHTFTDHLDLKVAPGDQTIGDNNFCQLFAIQLMDGRVIGSDCPGNSARVPVPPGYGQKVSQYKSGRWLLDYLHDHKAKLEDIVALYRYHNRSSESDIGEVEVESLRPYDYKQLLNLLSDEAHLWDHYVAMAGLIQYREVPKITALELEPVGAD